jgi:LPS-assembly protein
LPQGLRGWIVAVFLLVLALPALAQQFTLTPGKGPGLITADQVTYDRDLGVFVASGHVEASQGQWVVHSNTLTYNERIKGGMVTASGNVAVTDPSGNTYFGNYAELTGDLKIGVMKNIRMLAADKMRAAAIQGNLNGPVVELNKGVYSPCRPCEEKPHSTAPPIWQIKGTRVIHDNNEHEYYVRDAWMEIFGVPIFYTPYFSHPDSTVKRRSGFLIPAFKTSSNLGFQYQQPYFWAIAPDKDLTVTPYINTKAPPVMVGEYRQRVVNGKITVDFAGTGINLSKYGTGIPDNGTEFEGYLFTNGLFDLTDHWRAGFDINRTTDPAFLRLFGFQHEYDSALNSEVYGEGFQGRSYASIQGWMFQTMQESGVLNSNLPIVTPVINYNIVGDPNKYGAYWSINADSMILSRVSGTDSRRLLAQAQWTLPYTAPAGDIYKLSVSLRADGYWVQDVDTLSNTNPEPNPSVATFTGLTGRVFPQVSFDWRYPFQRRVGQTTQVFEPIFSTIVSPNGMNPNTIPNEDSQDFQLDETNLFDPSRVTGYDLVDSGQRVNYGAKYSIYGDEGGHTSLFLGQSYQIGPENAYEEGVGFGGNFSDVIGSLEVAPSSAFDVSYSYRIDATTGLFKRQEIAAHLGTPRLTTSLRYIFLNGISTSISPTGQAQEIYGTVSSQIDDNWSLIASGRRDLETNQSLEYGAGITYRNDCISVTLSGSRSNYTSTGVNPSTEVLLTLGFKTLGNYPLSF